MNRCRPSDRSALSDGSTCDGAGRIDSTANQHAERAYQTLAGRIGDRGHQRFATGVAFLAALAGYLITLARGHLWLLIAAAVLIDMAVQTTLVLGQQMIYSLKPAERSRLNTLYIATFFVGGAVGSAVASREYEHVGWEAVVATGTVLSFLALLYWLTEPRKKAV